MTSHRLAAAPVIGIWLVGGVLLGASPVLLGVITGWIVPWGGAPRGGMTGWSVLHLLWVVPTFILLSVLGTTVLKRAMPRLRVLRVAVDFVVSAVVLSVLLLVFFEEWAGACTAAVVAGIGYLALKPLFARWDRKEDETRADRV